MSDLLTLDGLDTLPATAAAMAVDLATDRAKSVHRLAALRSECLRVEDDIAMLDRAMDLYSDSVWATRHDQSLFPNVYP
jgi:hypothetical protein